MDVDEEFVTCISLTKIFSSIKVYSQNIMFGDFVTHVSSTTKKMSLIHKVVYLRGNSTSYKNIDVYVQKINRFLVIDLRTSLKKFKPLGYIEPLLEVKCPNYCY